EQSPSLPAPPTAAPISPSTTPVRPSRPMKSQACSNPSGACAPPNASPTPPWRLPPAAAPASGCPSCDPSPTATAAPSTPHPERTAALQSRYSYRRPAMNLLGRKRGVPDQAGRTRGPAVAPALQATAGYPEWASAPFCYTVAGARSLRLDGCGESLG